VLSGSKDDISCTPFELSVTIRHISLNKSFRSSLSQDKLRVSLEVGDYFVGVTAEGYVAALSTSGFDRHDQSHHNHLGQQRDNSTSLNSTEDYELDHRKPNGLVMSWRDNSFTYPLLSMFQEPIRFKLYREVIEVGGTETGCRGELMATSSDDALFSKELWKKPNRY
jgi:hypothetical protein